MGVGRFLPAWLRGLGGSPSGLTRASAGVENAPPVKAIERDRRASARYPASSPTAWLGWSDDRGFVAWPARVEDVAVGGARLRVRKGTPLPHRDTPLKLWLGDATPACDEACWIDVEILQDVALGDRGRELRLNFPNGCPYYVFSSAAWGQALAGARA